MRKGIYIPEYPTEPDDLVTMIAESMDKPDFDMVIARLRLERNIRIYKLDIQRLKDYPGKLHAEIHAQIASSGFGRPAIVDGKRIIKRFFHA